MALKPEELKKFFQKNRYAALILLCGVVLMCWPQGEKTVQAVPQKQTEASGQKRLEQELEELLGQAAGVGKVRVLLSQANSGETIYQTDAEQASSDTGSSTRADTVLISDGSRQETGLVRQTLAADYRGAIVVCQGGDKPAVKLAVVEAVAGVTGLPTNRISVLKME